MAGVFVVWLSVLCYQLKDTNMIQIGNVRPRPAEAPAGVCA